MKRGILCFVLAAFFVLPALAAERTIIDAEGKTVVLRETPRPDFFHYVNERFPFAVEVPALFTNAVVIPDNGDGIILSDAEDKARFRASGGRLVDKVTIRAFFESERKSLAVKPAYEKLGKNFFVLSWIEDGNIHYRKLILNEDAWSDMEISYPPERKKEFDPLVTHSAQSLKYFIE